MVMAPFMQMGGRIRRRLPGIPAAGHPGQFPGYLPLQGFEAPARGRRQIGGHGHLPELLHGPPNLLETRFEPGSRPGHGRGWPHQRERILQEGLDLARFRDPNGLDQNPRLPVGQAVAASRGQRSFLIALRQGRQLQGQGRAQPALGHRCAGLRREALGQFLPLHHPGLFAPQELGDARHRETVLGEQRLDHQGFVQRTERSPGRVGQQQHPLVVRTATAPLDDHRDLLASGLAPAVESLEPIDDLEPALADRNRPQRQIAQVIIGPTRQAWPEPFIRAPQARQWDKQHLATVGIQRGRGGKWDHADEHGGPSWVPSYEGGGGFGG